MHLLIINQYALPAGETGITRHGDLAAELVRRGHRVTIVASRFNYLTRSVHRQRITDHDGVEFRWIDAGSYRANDARRVRSMIAFSMRAVLAGMRGDRPDVIVGSSPHLLAGSAGRVLANLRRRPFVFEVRDVWPSVLVELGALAKGGWQHRLLELLEADLYRRSARIIVVPPGAGQRVAEVIGSDDRCVHVPNAASILDAAPVPLPDSLAAVFDAEAERNVLLYAGAHGISNDLMTLVRAMGLLRDTDRDTYDRLAVILVGEGAERERLREAVEATGLDHVHFHEPVPKGALGAAIERAAFGLVSFGDAGVYRYGVSPNKMFDYMAMGRPVLLASRLHDTPVQQFQAGLTYVPGDENSLAAGVTMMLDMTAEDRRAMGERGRRAVREHYTIAATAARLVALLEDAIGERH